MTTPAQKTCHGVLLPADAFAANKANPDGLQRYCRDCQKKMRADWTKRNSDKVDAYNARRRGEIPTPAAETSAAAPEASVAQNFIVGDVASISTVKKAIAASERRGAGTGDDGVVERKATGLAELPHSAIVPSLTNPRKHFDHAFVKELAESIKQQGLAQPILVRPLPGSRVAETFSDRRADAPRPTHEIVAGEQRWRALAMAGVRTVPVLIRRLTDAEVLQLQLVENLKRRDLHPMEEAEGYERLRDTLSMSAEDIADKIGKGRSYVYKTLKLIDLEPEAREAFYAGKLTRSTAELVAVRPPNLQLPFLKDITAPDFHGEPMSFRKAKAHAEDRYMLRLGSAPFKITDETLVPDAGSCRDCPKRSGASPELFDDVAHADTCTDTTCFGAKKEAHYLRIRTEAEAKGQTVIVGREAKEIMPDSHTLRGYTKLDDHQALGGQMKTLRKVLGDDMPTPVLIEDPSTHEMIAALPTAVVSKLLKDQGISKAPIVETNEAAAKRLAVEKFEKTWRREAIEKIDTALQNDGEGGFNAPVLRQLALMLVDGLSSDARSHTCTLLGLGRIAPREAIEGHIASCLDEDVDRVLLLLLVQHDAGREGASHRIDIVSKEYGIDVAAIRSSVQATMKKAAADAKTEGPAVAAKPVRKPKLSKGDAPSAISAAMQSAQNPNAFEVGQRVRILKDLRKGSNILHTAHLEAEILRPQGNRAWELQPTGLGFTVFADYTEIEAIEAEEDSDTSTTGDADPLYADALALVRNEERASISLVQRHFRIGYNRAARLLEAMRANEEELPGDAP